MAIRKKDKADLRKHYSVCVEIGAILSLLFVILAFRADIRNDTNFQVTMESQEVIDLDDIVRTKHGAKPPAPPRPPVPVEVPNDAIIESDPIDFDPEIRVEEPPGWSESRQSPKEKDERDFFLVVEEEPQLIGGMAALHEAVEYPEFAKKAGIEGTVFVQFIVNEEGAVTNVKVTRGVHKLLDEAAVEAVKQMKFKPGRQRSEPVKVQMSLPVRFRLR